MNLKDLFQNTDVQLTDSVKDIQVNKICYDSRKVKKGDLFVAVKGFETDGHLFVKQAEKNGAVAHVVESVVPDVKSPQIKVENSRFLLGSLAYNLFRKDIEALTLIGITGTNGKTTTSYIVRSILEAAKISCGLAGTIQYIIGSKKINAWNTTPESADLFEMLSEMKKAHNQAAVLEVSSHALALGRVKDLRFNAGVFTNLNSRDHMDFHHDMEMYFTEKMKLFQQLSDEGQAIINIDDKYGIKIAKDSSKCLTYGLSSKASIYTENWKSSLNGIEMVVETPKGAMEIQSSLIGDFNVYNILAAISVASGLNIPAAHIKEGIKNLKSVPGRLESYPVKTGARAVIDYSHTPDALEKALKIIRTVAENKVRVVFGCGGDRDKGKRPLMGKIAQEQADFIYVTNDNPRTEEPGKIIEEILEGISRNENVYVIQDRRMAITKAIKESKPGDVILVAGKGHESYQVIGTKKTDFDEVKIIKEAGNA